MNLHYRIVVFLIYLYLKIFRGLKIDGKEHIPKDTPVIFAANHISNLDPFALAASTIKPMGFFAKRELFFFPLGPIIRWFGAFPVDRQGNATNAIRSAIKIIKSGRSLVIFPEGTRNKSEAKLLPAKRGVALIAKKAQVPVVPVALTGTPGFFGPIRVTYAPPVISHLKDGSDYDAILDEIMSKIERALA